MTKDIELNKLNTQPVKWDSVGLIISNLHCLTWTRQHWAIENKLHYRQDVTLGEDTIRMKETHQAQVVATINNFIVALATYLGFSNLASARRVFQARFDALIFSAM